MHVGRTSSLTCQSSPFKLMEKGVVDPLPSVSDPELQTLEKGDERGREQPAIKSDSLLRIDPLLYPSFSRRSIAYFIHRSHVDRSLGVGNAFVQQYYHILQQSPELVYRFYQESSKLGRPDAHGAMSLVTTTNAINEKILSMGVARAEMKTVDAQESLGGGVLVLVTGYLTGEDSVKRDFTQSFFLAPQDKGYYVLNDILRFVEEADHQQEHQGLANGTAEPHVLEHDLPPEQEQHAPDQTVSEAVGDEEMNGGEVDNPEDNGEIVEEEDPSCEVIDEVPNTSQSVVVESNVVSAQEEVPKMSYAAIVINELQHSSVFWVSFFPCVCPADGYSIYVKNLPLDATPAQLEEEFKKHGISLSHENVVAPMVFIIVALSIINISGLLPNHTRGAFPPSKDQPKQWTRGAKEGMQRALLHRRKYSSLCGRCDPSAKGFRYNMGETFDETMTIAIT
ncbi:hypothetical protein GW17_00011479 [Ensete ventricosum]|nr:hypothetical protein GW17_00011479 [Ensete ventricosum]